MALITRDWSRVRYKYFLLSSWTMNKKFPPLLTLSVPLVKNYVMWKGRGGIRIDKGTCFYIDISGPLLFEPFPPWLIFILLWKWKMAILPKHVKQLKVNRLFYAISLIDLIRLLLYILCSFGRIFQFLSSRYRWDPQARTFRNESYNPKGSGWIYY